MAPVTRRAAKVQHDSPKKDAVDQSSAAENDTSFEEPIAVRSKQRKPSSSGAGEKDDNTQEDGIKSAAKVATPKHKKLEVRIRNNGAPPRGIRTEIEVQIPSSAMKTPRCRSSPVPDSQETGISDDVDEDADQTFEPFSASKQLEEEASQKLASRKRLMDQDFGATPIVKAAKPTRANPVKKSHGKSALQQPQSAESESEAETEAKATPQPAAAKSTHVKFGDDDDVDKFVAAAAAAEKDTQTNEVDGDKEEEESDDEAPEAVSTAAVAKDTLKSARAAIEAAEKYVLFPPLDLSKTKC
jgi:hypothetical protein